MFPSSDERIEHHLISCVRMDFLSVTSTQYVPPPPPLHPRTKEDAVSETSFSRTHNEVQKLSTVSTKHSKPYAKVTLEA